MSETIEDFSLGLDRVPDDHLIYLISKLKKPEAEQERLRRLLRVDARHPVLEALEESSPGICEKLEETWPFRSRRAIHLWQLPAFPDAARLRKVLRNRVPFDGEHATVGRSKKEVSWVENVRLKKGEVMVATRHVTERKFETVDGYKALDLVGDRMFGIDLERQQPLAEGYAGYNDARQSIRTFLGWVFEEEIPDRGDAQAKFLRFISFTEAQVKKLADRLELENVHTRGDDVRGDAGQVHIHGHLNGSRKAALNTSVEWIDNQVSGMNDEYGFNWDYEHEDGFIEKFVVHFVCTGKPHLLFPKKTSRLAIGAVIDELCAELKIM